MENSGRFGFYNNIYFFYEKPKTKQPVLRQFPAYTEIFQGNVPVRIGTSRS